MCKKKNEKNVLGVTKGYKTGLNLRNNKYTAIAFS